jgi:hypothetical protein
MNIIYHLIFRPSISYISPDNNRVKGAQFFRQPYSRAFSFYLYLIGEKRAFMRSGQRIELYYE